MPDCMDDYAQFIYSQETKSIPSFTVNIKFSDLFFDSIFNHEDYLLKYGCYILIEWNTFDNITWNITTTAS